MTAPFDHAAHNARHVSRDWSTGNKLTCAQWGDTIRSLNRQASAAIERRPDLQADWLAVMDGPHATAETLTATEHLASLSPERRAALEGEWA